MALVIKKSKQFTVAKVFGAKQTYLRLKTNSPALQYYSSTDKEYTPNYAKDNLVITPELTFTGSDINCMNRALDPAWKINGRKPGELGFYVDSYPPYSLHINKNLVDSPQYDIEFRCVAIDPDNYSASPALVNICITKQVVNNFTPAVKIETPDGTSFKNDNFSTLSAQCKLFIGATDYANKSKITWSVKEGNGYTDIADTEWCNGQGTSVITVSSTFVGDSKVLRCKVEYDNAVYYQYVNFYRSIDAYTLKIENKTGDKLSNGVGQIECEAHVYRSKEMVPDEVAERLFDFNWKRMNKRTGAEDVNWRKPTTRQITLVKEDVNKLSTFICELTRKELHFPYIFPFVLS